MSSESTAERLLRLLELLQRRAMWTAQELAEDLGVTTRCVRRDVERLRALGYPVRSTPGVGGGYQLGTGARMPPLMLDDEETVAVALALRLASTHAVTGAEDAALRALAKLETTMPPRLRERMAALWDATATLTRPGTEVPSELLLDLTRACHETVTIRFGYAGGSGDLPQRAVEPIRLVTTGRRWYLMGWDRDRADWRTFRLDRMVDVEVSDRRFLPRRHPDPAEFVRHSVTEAPYNHHVVARVRMAADDLGERIPPQVGTVEPDAEPGWSVLRVAADDLAWIAYHLAALNAPVRVLEPPELPDFAAEIAERMRQIR